MGNRPFLNWFDSTYVWVKGTEVQEQQTMVRHKSIGCTCDDCWCSVKSYSWLHGSRFAHTRRPYRSLLTFFIPPHVCLCIYVWIIRVFRFSSSSLFIHTLSCTSSRTWRWQIMRVKKLLWRRTHLGQFLGVRVRIGDAMAEKRQKIYRRQRKWKNNLLKEGRDADDQVNSYKSDLIEWIIRYQSFF